MPQKETILSIRIRSSKGWVLMLFAFAWHACDQIRYFKDPVKVELVNELQGCEEVNIHYTILKVYDERLADYEGQIVFPDFDPSIESDSLKAIFFPTITERRLKVSVIGFLSIEGRSDNSYGCVGAYQIQITKIVEIEDVTDQFHFPIRN